MSIELFSIDTYEQKVQAAQWFQFLQQNEFDFNSVKKIDLSNEVPVVFDHENRKFSLDFINDKTQYHKKKLSLKNELLSKAVGAGRYGMKVLDLSAGLGVDAIFLAQLGYEVNAVERNPLIYLCLKQAEQSLKATGADTNITFHFGSAMNYLTKINADVAYFDPMFPQKAKSALPRQEMVFFKNMVGADDDAADVLAAALKTSTLKRVAVKRPLQAPPLLKPNGQIEGKLIRYDIYGVNS